MWLLLVVCVVLLLLYIFFVKNSYWKNKGVPGPKPLPFVGNIGASILGQRNVYEIYADIYRQFEDCPFVGIYRMGSPILLLRDPEIIKNVLIKDFNLFVDNDIVVDKKMDPIFGRNPFVLKGEEWKKARQFMTPHFGTGKVKAMFPVVEYASKKFVKYLEDRENNTLNVKEVLLRYGCDVVVICALGIEGNSFEEPAGRFFKLIQRFNSIGLLQVVKLTISFLLPNLISVKLMSKDFDDGIISLTDETLRYRKQHNIKKNDFFDAITQTPSISLIDMAAHIATFMVEGSETVSVVTPLIFYELAQNPDCQTKLRKEIITVLKNLEGEFSYEAVQNMAYLEACINESFRLHPPFGQLTRVCTEDCTIKSYDNNLKVTLKKGSTVLIPLLGLHRDPKYFQSPNEFIPERFSDKGDSHNHVFMPFGNGPRMCLGSRFAFISMKVAIAQVIRNFEVSLDPKTIQPMKYDPVHFGLVAKGGIWLRCKKIKHTEDYSLI